MTKEDIKKALETCILGYCTGCPYDGCDGDCRDELHKDVLTLITEQEKSIQMAQQNQEYREQQVKQAKIDVLNKLKERAIGYTFLGEKLATETDIDELIKEVQNAENKG